MILPYIDSKAISVATQHVTDTSSGCVVGMEVFARFVTPDGVIIPPCPKNSEGRWALIDLSVAEIVFNLEKMGVFSSYSGFLALNLSAETLRHDASMGVLLKRYEDLNDRLQGGLMVEVSESALDNDIERHWSSLKKACSLVAMDDYGDGLATPERLERFDWDICKLDSPGVLKNHTLAAALPSKDRIIVEHIETRDDMRDCHRAGYERQQGYFHHKPLAIPLAVLSESYLYTAMVERRPACDKEAEVDAPFGVAWR